MNIDLRRSRADADERTRLVFDGISAGLTAADESIAGEVSLPLAEDAQEIEILVEVGDDIHKFRYKQRKYDP